MPLARRASSYNAGPELLRDVWALTAIAIVIVILRVIAKWRIGKFGLDDALMAFALCCATVGSILITLAIRYGLGREATEMATATVSKVIMFDYLTQTFAIIGGTIGRISFIVLIVGLLGSRLSYRIILWVLAGLQVVVNVMFIVIIFSQCPGHASAIWEHAGKAKCWDLHVQAYYGYFQGAFNATTDLYLAGFSTFIFWNLNLQLRVKLGLVALLGLGLFAMVAAIIKAIETRILATSDTDPTIATVNYDRWLYIEAYLVIITASIPCLRSLLRAFQGRVMRSRDTHELSSPYAVNSMRTTQTKRRESSTEGKRIVNIDEGQSNDEMDRHEGDNDALESACPRASVM
ncbi:uncharacterized protein N7459_006966, partial [Penicillium hispanicum]|uniref:uncharacterized protein n=1 Tax=Penicillium hispanicum TaxID=1080232 RepID=UPI002540F8D6